MSDVQSLRYETSEIHITTKLATCSQLPIRTFAQGGLHQVMPMYIKKPASLGTDVAKLNFMGATKSTAPARCPKNIQTRNTPVIPLALETQILLHKCTEVLWSGLEHVEVFVGDVSTFLMKSTPSFSPDACA